MPNGTANISQDEIESIIRLYLPLPPKEGWTPDDYDTRCQRAAGHITRELKERYEDE